MMDIEFGMRGGEHARILPEGLTQRLSPRLSLIPLQLYYAYL